MKKIMLSIFVIPLFIVLCGHIAYSNKNKFPQLYNHLNSKIFPFNCDSNSVHLYDSLNSEFNKQFENSFNFNDSNNWLMSSDSSIFIYDYFLNNKNNHVNFDSIFAFNNDSLKLVMEQAEEAMEQAKKDWENPKIEMENIMKENMQSIDKEEIKKALKAAQEEIDKILNELKK